MYLAAVEIVACVIANFVMEVTCGGFGGRKGGTVVFLATAGISCALAGYMMYLMSIQSDETSKPGANGRTIPEADQ